MLYGLFTAGRAALSGCLAPLLCLLPTVPLMAAALLGPSMRRSAHETRTARARLLHAAAHFSVSLGTLTVYLTLMGDFALRHARSPQAERALLAALVGGPPTLNRTRLLMAGLLGGMALGVVNVALHEGLREGGWLRERVDRLRRPPVRRGALGSSHFCTMREYRRYRRPDPEGVRFLGAFWGADNRRLDYGAGAFQLSGEDAARGILTLGSAGSGKTQGVILPLIGDRMLAGHSLIVADPQGSCGRMCCALRK